MTQRGRGRRPGDSGTREAIRAEARRQFGTRGYRATTLRSVAAEVGVDARLVHHYFGSKQELFVASVELPIEPAVIVERAFSHGIDEVGPNVATMLVEVLEDPGRRQSMLGILRAAITEPEAAHLIREILVAQLLGPIAERIGGTDPELRASLVATQLVGVAMGRYVVGLPPMAAVGPDRLVAILGPVFQGYLTGPLPDA